MILLIPQFCAQSDSLRHFGEDSFEKYSTNPKYNYTKKIVSEPNAFLEFVADVLKSTASFLFSTPGIIILVLLVLAFIIFGFKDSIFKKKLNQESPVDFVNTKLKNTDKPYEKLLAKIEKAEQEKDYKSAIRFIFVLVIRNLAENKQIIYHKEKTNSQYRKELPVNLQPHFKRLALIFDYTWYGKYPATEGTLNKAKSLAQTFKPTKDVA